VGNVAPRFIFGIFLGVLCAARRAHADPLPVELSWDAPVECPSRSEVMAELGRITRVKPGRVVTPISAQAKIERMADGHYKLRLTTQREDQTGDTDLEAATCPVLKRGVTLVLALALGDGVDLVDEKTPPPAPPAAPEVGAAPAPPARAGSPKPAATATPADTRERALTTPGESLHWSPWLAAAGAWGLVGKPSLGGRFGLTVHQTHWAAFSHVTLWPRESAPQVEGVAASFSALSAALGGCVRGPFAAWSLSACASFELGAIRGTSQGAFQDGSASAPWYAVGPSLVLIAPIYGSIALRAEAGLSIALDPPHFALHSFGDVYDVSRFVPVASLGIAFEPVARATTPR
jgi:hypothetical protein